ncbi:DUF885 family protein [Chloroflexota bacterium]
MADGSSSTEVIGQGILEAIARAFPVTCASDEFYYFPQVRLPEPQWSTWDQFSPDTITDFAQQVSAWRNELDRLSAHESDLQVQIDINLLRKLVLTLREQLSEVRSWEFQPTFYLTLTCIGLAEALESENPAAKHERVTSLPAFLDQSSHNLKHVPDLFRDIGFEMITDTRNYLVFLGKTLAGLQPVLAALDRFEDVLKTVSTRDNFLLPQDLLEHILRYHIYCDVDIQEINQVLDQEIEDMHQTLSREARHILSDRNDIHRSKKMWLKALESIPALAAIQEDLIGLYKDEIGRLARHCLNQGLVSRSLLTSCPVNVDPMPPFLSAIRSASSYSISPKYPPTSGKFYILTKYVDDKSHQGYHREYRMTCAHETYPGHHLLDASRWSLSRPIRRHIEQPIFYEGWACFAEELMRLTEYFSEPSDRLLLARRRLLHAIRGKVDLGLQTGTMDIPAAARFLEANGVGRERAMSLARKYTLNPGYQLCYTLGLHRFLQLFDRYGRQNLPGFVSEVLNQGETHFSDLEKAFKKY